MKAIIQIGEHQYVVEEGSLVDIHLVDKEVGAPISFEEVLSVIRPDSTLVGKPFIEGCRVTGEIISNDIRGEKVVLVHYEPRHHNRGKRGHRQHYTRVKITSIVL